MMPGHEYAATQSLARGQTIDPGDGVGGIAVRVGKVTEQFFEIRRRVCLACT
jgi:hypothetical protein